MCHILLGGKDEFVIDDICWGVCWVAAFLEAQKR